MMRPEEMRSRNAVLARLAEEGGPAYAAIIGRAGQLRKTVRDIGTTAAGYERGCHMLEGMTLAATDALTADRGMPYQPAYSRASGDVLAVAQAIREDFEAHMRRRGETFTLAPPEDDSR